MALSLDDVQAVLAEMEPVCVGGRIQNIQQPAPDTVIVALRRPGRSLSMLLSAHPRHGRLHLLSRKLPCASAPPSFCQYGRAHLLGATIHRVAHTPGDRVVWFELRKQERVFFLVVALIGRSANLFVLDAQATVLRSLKAGRWSVGQPFDLCACPWDTGVLHTGRSPVCEIDEKHFPVSERIEAAHLLAEQREDLERRRRQAVVRLRKQIKHAQRRVAKFTQDFEKAGAWRDYGRYGELLKSHLASLGKGQHHITVVDYFDDALPELTLPLNPEKDGPGNLRDYFRKYGKFTGAQKNLVPRLRETADELAQLHRQLHELETMEHPPEDKTGQREADPRQRLRQRPGQTPGTRTATPYRQFCSQAGQVILVGKSATDNETLTFGMSKPDDLWLHARGTPGSHVIVKLDKRQRVEPETLKDAAVLALFYSDLRKSGKGEVIYTLRKNVRKPKQAGPGSVSVTREKSLWVFVDRARLDRLKASVSR